MRAHTCSVALLLAIVGPPVLEAQSNHPRIAVGAGLLWADRGPQDYLSNHGTTAFIRIQAPRTPLLLEVSLQSVPLRGDLATDCLSPTTSCASIGGSTALTLAPAAQLAWVWPRATWLLRAGPSGHWLVRRDAGSPPLAAGVRLGLSLRPRHGRFLLSADYFRLAPAGDAPRWVLPVTLGWEF
jgi:hypothetical protein